MINVQDNTIVYNNKNEDNTIAYSSFTILITEIIEG